MAFEMVTLQDDDRLIEGKPVPSGLLPQTLLPIEFTLEEVNAFYSRSKGVIRLPLLNNEAGISFSDAQLDSIDQLIDEFPFQINTHFFVQEKFRLTRHSELNLIFCHYEDGNSVQLEVEKLDKATLSFLTPSDDNPITFNDAHKMPVQLARYFGIVNSVEDTHLLINLREEELYYDGLYPLEYKVCCHKFCGYQLSTDDLDEDQFPIPICCQKPEMEASLVAAFYANWTKKYGSGQTNCYVIPLTISRIIFHPDGTRSQIDSIDFQDDEYNEPSGY